jgi:release factor glutamine methyltransferase
MGVVFPLRRTPAVTEARSIPALSLIAACADLRARFAAAGVDDAEGDARRLVCAAAGVSRARLIADPDQPLTDEQALRLADWAERRLRREPVTRILGRRGFWTFDLDVRPDVLDPRPDTESLVEVAIARCSGRPPARLLDAGTGSGAIVAALLAHWPQARAVACDLSPAAAAAARSNLEALGMAARCDLRLGSWEAIDERFDLVVSNPPYIATGDLAGLDPEVALHDPRLALDGGADGLDAYRSLVARLPLWLAAGGVVALEIGHDQSAAVEALVAGAGGREVRTDADLAGRPRVVSAEMPPAR